MKLARYDLFVATLVEDETITRNTTRLAAYRHAANAWFGQDGAEVADARLRHDLDRAREAGQVQRGRGGKIVLFPVPAMDAIVEIAFSVGQSKDSQARIHRRIVDGIGQSLHRFKATHHDLTGLMNREEFNRVLIDRLETLVAPAVTNGGDTSAAGAPTLGVDAIESLRAVGVIAIDIDHFKQINDTYGHLYGDIVLRALAVRLETMLRRLSEALGVELIPAHPSGEEFLILMVGALSVEQEREIAEAVRREIGGRVLPTDAEWAELARGEAGETRLPGEAFRRVTISLGYTARRGAIDREIVRQLGFTLKNQADVALYKAKTAGRDQSVAFSDILLRFGRILEHHPETNIVAIDLGRHVNVSIGQEFLVYHPTFFGDHPFMFDDGRTRKKLGDYPRVSSGRIEVFQVQPEIAFCHVSDNRTRGTFPVGGLLEAVPLGSIAHLIPDEPHSRAGVPGRADLDERVRDILRRDSSPYAVVFAVTNADAIIETNGSAFVNRLLAELYSLIRKGMPRSPAVGQVLPTQLACVGFDDNDLDDSEIARVLRQVDDAFGGVAKLVAGVYQDRDRAKFAERQDIESLRRRPLDAAGALEYARYATLAARHYDKAIVHFDYLTPDLIIFLSRTSATIEQTEKDYAELERSGAVNSRARNQLALAYFSARKYETADALFAGIIDLKLVAPALRATYLNNAATNKFLLGDTASALAFFRRAMEFEGRVVPDPRFRGYFALVNHEHFKSSGGAQGVGEIRDLLRQALAQDARDLPKWQVDRLRNALAEIGSPAET